MSVTTIIKLAYGLMQFINWLTREIDESKWEASGYRKAMQDELAAAARTTGMAKEAFVEASTATPEERRRSLKEPI